MQLDPDLVSIRKHLHAHPELSGQESQTAKFVAEALARYQATSIVENVGGTGLLATFDSGEAGPTILFRADLDALPIQEVNTFAHRSTIPQVSHKCGHDGHSTILLGLAKKLSQAPFSKGKVVLLFQPAEENGTGAHAVLNDPQFQSVQPDFVFALHNLPGYPLHQVVVRDGSFTAAVISVAIHLSGKTAHAAEPEHGINPALAIAEILQIANKLSNNLPEQEDFAVVTPIHVEMGSVDYGISAGHGTVRFTLRTWTESKLQTLKEKVVEVAKIEAETRELEVEFEFTQHFAANENAPQAVELIRKSAKAHSFDLETRPYPFKWGEDFGLFTQGFKGAMFGLGAGEDSPALHNPDYDFPDALIPTGAQVFYGIAAQILG